MVVRVPVREQRRHQPLEERAVGPVVVALALLVLDHVALVVQVLLAQRVEQRGHPVGLEPQAELQLVRRQGLEVVGAVEVGGGVVHAAGALDDAHVLGLGDVPRALEHEVLEEVRKAGLAGLLVLRADVVPEVDGHHRRQVVRRDDHPQAVVQALVGEGDRRAVGVAGGHGCSWAGRKRWPTIVAPAPPHRVAASDAWSRSTRGGPASDTRARVPAPIEHQVFTDAAFRANDLPMLIPGGRL